MNIPNVLSPMTDQNSHSLPPRRWIRKNIASDTTVPQLAIWLQRAISPNSTGDVLCSQATSKREYDPPKKQMLAIASGSGCERSPIHNRRLISPNVKQMMETAKTLWLMMSISDHLRQTNRAGIAISLFPRVLFAK